VVKRATEISLQVFYFSNARQYVSSKNNSCGNIYKIIDSVTDHNIEK